MKLSPPHLRLAMVLLALLAWCGLLILARTLWTWSFDYVFLIWNLALATTPLILSSLIVWNSHWISRAALAPLWLLFLPNAPYMITDFIHLRTLDSGPLWLDVLLLVSCSGMGLVMGYFSVMQIQSIFRPRLGWLVATVALLLSGLGIYLGRFLRWRSVDMFRDPFGLALDISERVFNPLLHYRAWGMTLGFGVVLILGYVVFRSTVWAKRFNEREPTVSH